MAVQPQYLAYILEQLAGLSTLRANRMFGGIGLYSDGLFFALIDDDTLFFKTGDGNIEPYRARRMPRFMPFPDRPESVLGYHQVPADIIEDAETLLQWARQSVQVALQARAARPVKTRAAAGGKPANKQTAKKTTAKRKPAKKNAARKKPANKAPARLRARPARKKK